MNGAYLSCRSLHLARNVAKIVAALLVVKGLMRMCMAVAATFTCLRFRSTGQSPYFYTYLNIFYCIKRISFILVLPSDASFFLNENCLYIFLRMNLTTKCRLNIFCLERHRLRWSSTSNISVFFFLTSYHLTISQICNVLCSYSSCSLLHSAVWILASLLSTLFLSDGCSQTWSRFKSQKLVSFGNRFFLRAPISW